MQTVCAKTPLRGFYWLLPLADIHDAGHSYGSDGLGSFGSASRLMPKCLWCKAALQVRVSGAVL